MRQTAGVVMTHLILKDMVKVKGQVSEMAALLIDPEEAIMAVAQNFFNELSHKASGCSGFLIHKNGKGLARVGSITQEFGALEKVCCCRGSICCSSVLPK